MPLGTLDRTPPPFFRQGPSAATKLVFFAALALFLMVADTRMQVAAPLRDGLAIVLLPLQRTAAVPVDLWHGGMRYMQGLDAALQAERQAREALALQSAQVLRAQTLAAENERLRQLLDLEPAMQVRSLAAEVLYEAADPFSRKLIIGRGQAHAVALGAPVINEHGVLGQVTRVYALTSEVTLLADKDAAIPVLNTRTGQRSAAFGTAGGLELRYLPSNADVAEGDALHTSGVDGVYPPGLPVGRIVRVQRRVDAGFARIEVALAAPADGVRHVLVLEPLALQLPPRPEPEPGPAARPQRRGTGPVVRGAP
jgi:rod shape-determining protein MreC